MFKRIAVFGVLLPIFAVLGISTPANAVAGGGVVIQCTAHLSLWPSPGGSATCDGTALGIFVVVSASTNPNPEVIVCVSTSPCSFNASFTYSEPCPPPLNMLPVPPPLGIAEGTFTVTNGTDTVTGQFSWERVGATAAITLAPTSYDGQPAAGTGAAVAAFAPTNGPGTCLAPQANQSAEVVAVGAFVATTP